MAIYSAVPVYDAAGLDKQGFHNFGLKEAFCVCAKFFMVRTISCKNISGKLSPKTETDLTSC